MHPAHGQDQFSIHLQASINFDAGHDALTPQHIHEGSAICTGLVQSLLKHDGSADVLAQVWGCVQQLAPVTPVGLCVVNACNVKGECVEAGPRQAASDASDGEVKNTCTVCAAVVALTDADAELKQSLATVLTAALQYNGDVRWYSIA